MNKFITFFCICAVLFFAASYARADQYSSIVYEISNVPQRQNKMYTCSTKTMNGDNSGAPIKAMQQMWRTTL